MQVEAAISEARVDNECGAEYVCRGDYGVMRHQTIVARIGGGVAQSHGYGQARGGPHCKRVKEGTYTGEAPIAYGTGRSGVYKGEEALPFAKALVIGEEEKFVPPEGSTQTPAELILLVLRFGRSRFGEEIPGVEL